MIYVTRNLTNGPGCVFYVFLFIGTIFMFVALLLLAISGSRMLREQGYQSGQCMIIARQLQHELSTSTNTDSNGHKTTTTTDVYAPHFKYSVRTADGHSYTASGYDGSDNFSSNRESEQAIVDYYKVEQSYLCWYDPADPTQAILVRQTDWVGISIGGGFLIVGALFAGIGAFSILRLFRSGELSWRPLGRR